MTLFYNRSSEKTKRRFLRNNMTATERILWQQLKGRQLGGFKFRRQFSVGAFVLDFYCPELKLAIEVDGESHDGPEAQESDRDRQKYIEQFHIWFLRFRNEEVEGNVDAVVDKIHRAIERHSALQDADHPLAPSLHKEGVGGGRRTMNQHNT
ncbi:MAG: endonuclease domain-containing protein [Bacteroidetes bacterium]|nr:endonuclease domain-containing protein [Bacteroidota bacterium]MCW5896780.1 endonuclease domain-containing protein [Bacteroidota bacterium]